MVGNTFFAHNRYSNLRDFSPAARSQSRDFRDRSASVKRKNDSNPTTTYTSVANMSISLSEEAELDKLVESSSTEIAKVQSLCNTLNNTIMNLDMDDPFKDLLKDMCSAITGLGIAQESILAIVKNTKLRLRPTHHTLGVRVTLALSTLAVSQ